LAGYSALALERNKGVVRRYFQEALDPGAPEVVNDLFAENCVIYRPGLAPLHGLETVRLIVAMAHEIYSEFRSTLHDIVAEGDTVAVRLTHNAVYRGSWATPLGTFDCTGQSTQWEAMVIFKIHDGKIVEERVVRDELGMMINIGLLQPAG
jgi:predicted ester cyclase